jgi:hypothetical protein
LPALTGKSEVAGLVAVSAFSMSVTAPVTRAVGRKSRRRLNADARGRAGDEDAFPVQIGPRQNLVSVEVAPHTCVNPS